MKTETTKELERLIFFESKADKIGTYGAFEVALGEAYGNEYVDYMTMSSEGEFRCYEIKQNYSDLHSKAKLSFYGDYNYLVMTEELYQETLLKENKWWNIGIYIRKYDSNNSPYLKLIKKAPKKTVAPWKRYELTHCMVRSLSRLTTEKMKIQLKIQEEQDTTTKKGQKLPCPVCGQKPKIVKLIENNNTTYKLTCPEHQNNLPYSPKRVKALSLWNEYYFKIIKK